MAAILSRGRWVNTGLCDYHRKASCPDCLNTKGMHYHRAIYIFHGCITTMLAHYHRYKSITCPSITSTANQKNVLMPILTSLVAQQVVRMTSGATNDYMAVYPDSKFHEANTGPIWGRQDPGGSHVGPMNFVIWVHIIKMYYHKASWIPTLDSILQKASWITDALHYGRLKYCEDALSQGCLNINGMHCHMTCSNIIGIKYPKAG